MLCTDSVLETKRYNKVYRIWVRIVLGGVTESQVQVGGRTMLRRRRTAATLAAPCVTAESSGRRTAPPRDSTHGCASACFAVSRWCGLYRRRPMTRSLAPADRFSHLVMRQQRPNVSKLHGALLHCMPIDWLHHRLKVDKLLKPRWRAKA